MVTLPYSGIHDFIAVFPPPRRHTAVSVTVEGFYLYPKSADFNSIPTPTKGFIHAPQYCSFG